MTQKDFATDPGTGSYLSKRESNTIMRSLDQDDQITHMARQKRRSGDVISPSVIVTTSKKLVVVTRTMAGLRSHIKFIPYQEIGEVRITHGILVSSIFIKAKGAPKEHSQGDTEIKALATSDADILFVQLNDIVSGRLAAQIVPNFSGDSYISKNFEQERAPARNVQIQTAPPRHVPRKPHLDFTALHRFRRDEGESAFEQKETVEQVRVELTETSQQSFMNQNKSVQNVKAEDLLIFKHRKQRGNGIFSRLSLLVNRNGN